MSVNESTSAEELENRTVVWPEAVLGTEFLDVVILLTGIIGMAKGKVFFNQKRKKIAI
jgi:hypothetical protein